VQLGRDLKHESKELHLKLLENGIEDDRDVDVSGDHSRVLILSIESLM